jgi:hypothetical protein
MRIRTDLAVGLACVLACSSAAQAASELRVRGSANIDGDFTPDSSMEDIETGPPLTRTSISVEDALPGVWHYYALADMTTPRMAIAGSLTNTGDAMFSEVPVLAANSSLTDTIAIGSPGPDPYVITAELIVNGTLDVDGSNGTVIAEMTINPIFPNQLPQSEFAQYSTNGAIVNDVLPISYTFVGDSEFEISSRLFLFVTQIDANTSVSIDFSNTAIIRLTIQTLGGDPAPGIVIESGSGVFGTAPIPVPAALPLLGCALAGLAFYRRRH